MATDNDNNHPDSMMAGKIDKSANTDDNQIPSWRQRISSFLFTYHLPIGLIVLLVFGVLVPQPGTYLSTTPLQYICIVYIFLNSGLKLKTDDLISALKSFRASLWGLLSIFLVTSVIGTKLTSLLPYMPSTTANLTNVSADANDNYTNNILGPADFSIGLQIFFCCPCTISSGVLMVSQAGGNYALAVMLTVVSNTLGAFVCPLIVAWLTSVNSAITPADIGNLIRNLSLTVLLPLVVGKALSYIKVVAKYVKKYSNTSKLTSSFALILIPWMKVSSARSAGAFDLIFPQNILMIILWSLAVHILFLLTNSSVSWLILRLDIKEAKTIVILASQKTLSIAVVLISYSPSSLANQGLMTVAVVIAHMTQILADALVVAKWSKYGREEENKKIDDVQSSSRNDTSTEVAFATTNVKSGRVYLSTV